MTRSRFRISQNIEVNHSIFDKFLSISPTNSGSADLAAASSATVIDEVAWESNLNKSMSWAAFTAITTVGFPGSHEHNISLYLLGNKSLQSMLA